MTAVATAGFPRHRPSRLPEDREMAEESVIGWSVIRILVAEVVDGVETAWEREALVRALARAVARRRDRETGPAA